MKMYVWYPVVSSAALGFLFMNIPPLAGQFMNLFGVGYDALSLLLSSLFWAYALAQVPSGMIVDRLDPRRVLSVSLILTILANLLPFLAPASLSWAFCLRFLTGVCASVAFMAILKLINILAPPAQLAHIQGLQGAGYCFGVMVPYLVLPHLGGEAWRMAYLLGAGLLAPTLALSFLLPRRPYLPSPGGQTRVFQQIKAALLVIISSKAIWAMGIFHGLFYGSMNNLAQWLPSILADLRPEGGIGAWASATILMLLMGALGRAFLGDLFLRRCTKGVLVDRAILLTCLLYLVLSVLRVPGMLIAGGIGLTLICSSTYGAIFALAGTSVNAVYVGTAIGFMNMIANLFNVSLTLLFGVVREYTQSFSPALATAGACGLACWFFFRGQIKNLGG